MILGRVTDLDTTFHFSDSCSTSEASHTHLILMCLPLVLFYSAATKSLDTEMAPKVGMLVASNLQFCAESISDSHNDLFTGAEPRLADLRGSFSVWQGSDVILHPCDSPMFGTSRSLEVQISDDRTNRSSEAPSKRRRRHHHFRDGRRKAQNEQFQLLLSLSPIMEYWLRMSNSSCY